MVRDSRGYQRLKIPLLTRIGLLPMGVFLASALEYAARGWYVLPVDLDTHKPVAPRRNLNRGGRVDFRSNVQRRDWLENATVDSTRVCQIWADDQYGVAIACGPSQLLVLDTATDDYLAAENTVIALARQLGPFPTTWTVCAPSGGLHRYYEMPPGSNGFQHPTNVRRLGAHINIRSTNHYVIAPPTSNSEGAYSTLITSPVVPLPDWIAKLLIPPAHQ